MRKIFLILLVTSFITSFSQEDEETYDDTYEHQGYEVEDEYEKDYTEFYNDTLTYNKDVKYSKKRAFNNNLNEKYNGQEFTYIDKLKKQKEPQQEIKEKALNTTNTIDIGFVKAFGAFMSNIFPYLLGILVVFIIVKSFIKTDKGFWNFKRTDKKQQEELLYNEEEDIDTNDYDRLLTRAIKEHNFRLAIRFYYLAALKKLSLKGLIKYDKDKTNTEYQFELKNKKLRSNFAYISYVYDYVWYGEFPVDEMKFTVIEKKYKSFIQSI